MSEYNWEIALNNKPEYDIDVLCKVKGFGMLSLKLKKIKKVEEITRAELSGSAFFRLPLPSEELWYCEETQECFKYNMVTFWTYTKESQLRSRMECN